MIVILSLALLAACFAVILRPGMVPSEVGAIARAATLLFIGLLVVGRGALWHKPKRSFWVLIAAVLLTAPFIVIAQGFGGFDMMAFLFHLEFGIEGAGFEELHNATLTAILALGWITFSAYALSRVIAWQTLSYLVVSVLLSLSHPMVIYAATTVLKTASESDLAERLVLAPHWNGTATNSDLVVLYLEGMEEAYFDTSYLGEGLAPFAAIRDDGLRFTAVRQIEGTGWSMAGVVATQCGVPLVPNGFRRGNDFDGIEDFLVKHRCLGDILKQAGYRLEFLQGGDLEFAGYGTFLRQHGFDKVIGIEYFRENYHVDIIDRARIDRIVDDQLIFTEALRRHRTLLEHDAPYGLFIETITNHGDTAFASRECQPDNQARLVDMNPMVLACVGRQLAELVKALREQAGLRPMRLVILSDHLNHSVRLRADLPLADRANTAVMIDPQGGQRAVIDKEGSMVDIYPTLLDWLELAPSDEQTQAGLGVSLLSLAPTLVEEKGLIPLNEELYINPELSRAIWHETPRTGE